MKYLNVMYSGWGESWQLGTLADNGEQTLFEYSADALKQKLELSPLRLPLREQAYTDFPDYLNHLPGLISDCLPDGWGLLVMDRLFKKQGLNLAEISPLDRLQYIGGRAMGALTFHPHPETAPSTVHLNLKSLATEVQKIISDQPTKALQEIALVGGSPHGARPKALLQYNKKEKSISSDPNADGDSWLFKFPAQNESKEVCAIEKLYSELALACGLKMSPCEFFDLGKNLSAFGTERFDIAGNFRVPTHTAAGALHANFRMPSTDYLSLLRLIQFMTRDQREVNAGFLQCVFNVIFHNRDDHAKNFSFRLNQNREWKLSPAYDLTFSHGPGGEHQMDISGEGKNPTRAHLMRLAKDNAINETTANEYIERVCDVANKFKELSKEAPIRSDTLNDIQRAIKTSIQNMKK